MDFGIKRTAFFVTTYPRRPYQRPSNQGGFLSQATIISDTATLI